MILSPPVMRPEARNVLLLQGLVGSFFRRVGAALRAEGYRVFKINFNGGDRLFWGFSKGGIDYNGNEAEWPAFLADFIEEKEITDVLLFGDCRPIHRAAIAVCRDLRIAVHVFDEGYIRPDWVTFELGGVNGHSRLPRDPAYYRARAEHLAPAPPHHPVASSFRRRALEAVIYDAANILTRGRFPHWRSHRPWPPIQEGLSWLRRLARRKQAGLRTAACLARLERTGAPYMLFSMQLDSDSQIQFHSGYANMEGALRQVVQSFALHAAAHLRLLVKEHPLDNGLQDWARLVAQLAATYGVADRVDFIENGDIALIVRRASGLVTINSTTGTLALACDVPVITLGYAVYDMPGITYQGSLDAFWNAPGKPDAETFAAFRRVLIERCLVAGGFFSSAALDQTVGGVVARLKAHCPADFAARSLAANMSVPQGIKFAPALYVL